MILTFGATLYNEESNVPNITRLVLEVLKRFPDDRFILVDNGSTDSTFSMLSTAFQNNQSVTLIQNENSRGYGDGIRRVLREVKTENVLTFPGDFQFQINEIIGIRSFWEIEKCDRQHWNLFSVRKRYDGMYQATRGIVWRIALCWIFGISIRFDPASQLRVLCVDCVGSLNADDFTIDIEMLKKLTLNKNSNEISTYKARFSARNEGKSSIETGIFTTEIRVVLACFKLRRTLH
jgi:glycosyltransferase involved in cell wall biosynthesis